LADEIAKRSSRDLRPIPEQHVFLEVRALTDTINDLLERLGLAIAASNGLSPMPRINYALRWRA